MVATHTIGVLSPFVGGDYYGAVLAGINMAAVEAGGQVVAIQTLDPGSRAADDCGVPDFRRRVAWRHLDGVIVMPGAVDADYVVSLQETGRPVTLVGHELPGVCCPRVGADNRSGVREAVGHLVGHGHRVIGFAGFLGAADVRERYEGYRDAMAAHGLECPPELLVMLTDNHETAGTVAAERIISGRWPVTAVVAGTDRNAMGMMRHLLQAGYKLPDDLAMVGFDDIPDARYLQPSLSSVCQPLRRIGREAHALVAAALDGASPLLRTLLVPTAFVRRSSCGCPHAPVFLSEEQARGLHADVAYLQRTLDTQYELGTELLRSHERDARELAWLSRTPALGGCLGLWSTGVDPMAFPGSTPDVDPILDLVGRFQLCEPPMTPTGSLLPASAFPPVELFQLAETVAADEIVFLVPVRSLYSDWGLLAAVSRIQDTTPPGREVMNQSGALLSVALEQLAMLRSLRDQERQLRHAASFDQLTDLPNRALFLDRLRQTSLRAAQDEDYRYAVLFLDLDGFKDINDTMGHAAGDHVLIEVAKRITSVTRDSDIAARFGGDEFLILLTDVPDDDTPLRIVRRLEAALAEPIPVLGQWVQAAASIGFAMSTADSHGVGDILHAADAAMYQAKSARRGCVR